MTEVQWTAFNGLLSMTWFLYDKNLRHERINHQRSTQNITFLFISKATQWFFLTLPYMYIFCVSVSVLLNRLTLYLLQTLERQGGCLAHVRKTATKAIYFTQNTWNLVQHVFGLVTKILTLVKWSKWWRQHHFWLCNHSTTNFFVLLSNFFFA